MAEYEEHVIGEVASEGHYNPSWPTPTWEELGNFVEDQRETEFVLVPLGKIGSDKRAFGSKAAPIHKDDIFSALRERAELLYPRGVGESSDDYASRLFAASAIMQSDPSHSAALTEKVCALQNKIVHLTGWAIIPIR
jgi:hypothetical protein